MGRLILATATATGLAEMRELLPGVELRAAAGRHRDAAEDVDSFEANALIKARAAHAASGAGGARRRLRDRGRGPRRRSGDLLAGYAGIDVGDEVNLAKLLREVDVAGGDRRAAYVCALALIEPDGSEHVSKPAARAACCDERRGTGGFGYDPAFVPDDTGPATNGRWPSQRRREERDQPSRPRRRLLAGVPGQQRGPTWSAANGRRRPLDRPRTRS